MIRYRLLCDNAHEFDGWFRNGDAFDKAADADELTCPICGSATVTKALMTPAVAGTDKGETTVPEPQEATEIAKPPTAVATAIPGPTVPAEMVDTLRKLKQHVVENADYVGGRFAEEARRIHYNEVEPRGIYGEA
ncbi:MAG: DUF1178 family protein, partial [Hyphomicrobiales bacterium]|nr:DUF1178 family protein [Hyphomicrobiales bacterium]